MWLGLVLMNDGRLDRARQEMERALQLDPLSLIANENRGEVDYHARNYDAAARQFRKTLDLDPAFIWSHVALAATLSMQGKQAEALAESEQIHLPPVHDVLRATILARAGRREEALALARDLEHRMGGAAPRPVDMGRLYVALGDVDRAFAAFQQACDGESFATDLKVAPDYDAIRSDPRYHALLRCLKLE
jgi:serine/threonine-protein kinase